MTVLLAVSACEKGSAADENQDTAQPVERPTELVTEVYRAYPYGKNACVDSYLTIEFGTVPETGTSGQIRIIRADGTVADMIDMADVAAAADRPQMTGETLFNTAMDAIGSGATGYYRIVWYDPVTVDGNTVTVRLHSDRLDYGEEYSVEIDDGVILADGFDGIASGEWTFSVMQSPEKDAEVTAGGRDSDFMTIQGAVNFANSCGQSHELTISVAAGIYEEQLYIRSKNNLTIKGAGKGNTVIRADNCNDYVNGVGSGVTSVPEIGEPVSRTGGRSVVLVENCDMLRLEDISIENTHGHGSQAETIYFNCDNGRLIASGCNFTSEQDTIELKGWCLFRGCKVTGDVDFIWGYAKAALFDSCEICSCSNDGGGYVVQARCAAGDRGFVFLDCTLTSEGGTEEGSVYLARSGGSRDYYDNVSYISCRMSSHIADAGWYSNPAPNPSSATSSQGWKEYRSMNLSGVPLDLSSRYHGSAELSQSDCEALYKDAAAVFSECPHGTSWAE